jgi:hypothetical protein
VHDVLHQYLKFCYDRSVIDWIIVNGRPQNGGGHHLGFFAFSLALFFFSISRYVKYIVAKFGENPVDSNELAA